MYNITFEPPCIVRARAEVEKKQYPMIIDICRMWELIDLFRQQQLNPVTSRRRDVCTDGQLSVQHERLIHTSGSTRLFFWGAWVGALRVPF